MTTIENVNSIPEYIDIFIKNNHNQLINIHNNGLKENDDEGCLYMICKKSEDKMDVCFLNKENILLIISKETWEGIKESSENRKFIINDLDNKRIFIINI